MMKEKDNPTCVLTLSEADSGPELVQGENETTEQAETELGAWRRER